MTNKDSLGRYSTFDAMLSNEPMLNYIGVVDKLPNTANSGNVAVYDDKEWIYDGYKWHELSHELSSDSTPSIHSENATLYPQKCSCCGASLHGTKCEYCGTEYIIKYESL